MKKLLLIILAALVLGAVTVTCAAIYLGSAADAIMDASWDDITGKDVPVPWPLSEAEIQALRDELAATWPEDDPDDPIAVDDGDEAFELADVHAPPPSGAKLHREIR